MPAASRVRFMRASEICSIDRALAGLWHSHRAPPPAEAPPNAGCRVGETDGRVWRRRSGHSTRNALTGSTRSARRAGHHAAQTTVNTKMATAVAYAVGSRWLTP
jgi:hypothetical protein